MGVSSSLEKEVAALRQAEQAAVGSPVLPEPKHECDWHEHRANAGEAVSVSGTQETNLDAWLDHLRNTLYSEDSRPLDAFGGQDQSTSAVHRSNSLQDTSQPLLPRALQEV